MGHALPSPVSVYRFSLFGLIVTPLSYPSRRQALKSIGCGFGFLSASALANQQANAAVNPLAEKEPHFAPRAKRVIFLFMQGGPSQVDTFDYKSRLAKHDGEMHTFDDARVLAKTKEIVAVRNRPHPFEMNLYYSL